MADARTALEPWVEAARRSAADLGGSSPRWLSSLRARAVDELARVGFPTRRDEEWRYTNVRPIVEGPFRAAPEAAGEIDIAAIRVAAFDGPTLVFVDGRLRSDLSRIGTLPSGATVEPLSAALARGAPGLEGVLSAAPAGTHPFRALNTACFADGLHLHLAEGVALPRPVRVLAIGGSAGAGACHIRHRIALERGASATVVEEYRGSGERLTNAVTDIAVGEGARLVRAHLCEEAGAAHHIGFLSARQEAGSRFQDFFLATAGALVRNEIEVLLDGEEAECNLYGLYHLDGARQLDNHTLLRHAKPRCRSWEVYRGILDGRSRGIFTGKIHVFPDAQKTDAKQNSNTILLSREAEADTRPRLEIHADDVRCTHGATVGELDDAALFYLRTRGIDPAAARRMLVRAFASEVFATLEDTAIRAELEGRLAAALARSGGEGR